MLSRFFSVWGLQPPSSGGEDPKQRAQRAAPGLAVSGRREPPGLQRVIAEHTVQVGDVWTKAKRALPCAPPQRDLVLLNRMNLSRDTAAGHRCRYRGPGKKRVQIALQVP